MWLSIEQLLILETKRLSKTLIWPCHSLGHSYLPIARVRARSKTCGIYGGQMALGQAFFFPATHSTDCSTLIIIHHSVPVKKKLRGLSPQANYTD
jgi:hypothetical protein